MKVENGFPIIVNGNIADRHMYLSKGNTDNGMCSVRTVGRLRSLAQQHRDDISQYDIS
jgi:hypothetical protein